MGERFYFRSRGTTYSIPLEEILYLENELRQIHICMDGGDQLFYGTFRGVLPLLDERFLVCSKSYILNMDRIRAVRPCEFLMDNGEKIGFSRKSYQKAKAALEEYLEQKRMMKKTRKNPRNLR